MLILSGDTHPLPKPVRDKYQYSGLEFGPMHSKEAILLLAKGKCAEELGKGKQGD